VIHASFSGHPHRGAKPPMGKRIVRARLKIADVHIRYRVPPDDQLPRDRAAAVGLAGTPRPDRNCPGCCWPTPRFTGTSRCTPRTLNSTASATSPLPCTPATGDRPHRQLRRANLQRRLNAIT
jgi:hypothetical protein